ncbi:MAG: outer membrane lipoprotein-sorting protein [Rhodospirillaceae bacterium]|nr:outer membrane lipoprotein-sorting protein [Rhodospirillaceae bacterium]
MTDPSFGCTTRRLAAACLALLACLCPAAGAGAASPEEAGLKIARDAYDRDKGFGNFTARQTMVLRNKRGQESRRQLRIKVLEVEDSGNRTLFVFDRPRNVKGTAFLIHSHRTKADDQWLYLPALKRVKRISSSNRSGSFMGSEFSYEDLGSQEIEKYTYKFLREEACGKRRCTVVEQVPTAKRSGYRRQLVWRDKEDLRLWKIAYYDRKNAHLKTLTLSKYKRHLDRFWRAGEMKMVNHLTGKSTDMLWSDYKFGGKVSESDFSRTGLKRAR